MAHICLKPLAILITTAALSGTLAGIPLSEARAESNVNIALSETFAWDSNPLNKTSGENDIYGSETRAQLTYDRQSNNLQWATDFIVLHDHFNESDFNSTDFYFDLDAAWSTPTSQLTLQGGYDYDTTRDEESTILGTDISADRRESWTAAPRYTYRVTERFSLDLEGEWQETRYDDNALTDFRTISASPSLRYSLSPLMQTSLGAQVRRYEPLDIDGRQVDSYGPVAGWSYNFHPNYTLSLSGGYLGTSFEGYPGIDDDRQYNPIYSATLQYNGADRTASIGLTRSRQAFANGTESDQTTLRVSASRDINAHLDVNVSALYQNAEQDVATGSNFDSALAQSFALNYKIGQRWSASLIQRYRQEEFSNLSDKAKRNIVKIGLQYDLGDVY